MKNELKYDDIKEIFSKYTKWRFKIIDSKTLDSETRQKSIKLILEKLNSKNASIRSIASHMIIEFQLEQAKQKLIERINDRDTLNNNGTMTYALSHLNCQNNLKDVYKILATQSYESKIHAYNILSEQEFIFGKNDLIEMRELFHFVMKNKEVYQILDDETFEMVRDGFEGFQEYLN